MSKEFIQIADPQAADQMIFVLAIPPGTAILLMQTN
jgi:hypothetical protein